MEELRKQAEELTVKRKLAREQAYEWTKSSQLDVKDSDDEKEVRKARKAARARVRPEPAGSGDEAKKKRRGKLRRSGDGGDDEVLFSGDEDGDNRPAARKVNTVAVTDRTTIVLIFTIFSG